MKEVRLRVLGTGAGVTHLLYGQPSSSFVIYLRDEEHLDMVLLCDLGGGVVKSFYDQFPQEKFPSHVWISHNHSDHAGELPVTVAVNYTKKNPLEIIAEEEVLQRLLQHRMHELRSAKGLVVENIATWRTVIEGKLCGLEEGDFELRPFQGRHEERSFGFVLYYRQIPVLGWSGDSGFNEELYEHLSEAKILLVDGRTNSSSEHASFAEINEYFSNKPTELSLCLFIQNSRNYGPVFMMHCEHSFHARNGCYGFRIRH